MDQPILIDLADFFKTGRFDYVLLGQNKQWLKRNFPDPDGGDWDEGRKFSILSYGQLELHFENDRLYLIYSDQLTSFNGGDSLKIDPWFLADSAMHSFMAICTLFHQEAMNFSVQHQVSLNQTKLTITKSQLVLYFADDELTGFAYQ